MTFRVRNDIWHLGSVFRVIFYPPPDVKAVPEPVVPTNVLINVPINERQQWFLNQFGVFAINLWS